MSGTLFIVATPIGNLGDITLRAIETLRACDRVVAEDTRRARALLSHLGIAGKPIDRVDANASDATIAKMVERIAAGESIALITDAGTPVVSDPGTALVEAVAAAGHRVVPIPGASALLAALSVSGLISSGFRFFGFLPRSGSARRDAIEIVRDTPEPAVLFESPERAGETIAELAQAMPDRRAAIARELTKVHEEIVRGTLEAIASQPREWLGEITIVLGVAPATRARSIEAGEIDTRIDAELAKGRRAKDVAESLALEMGLSKRDLYTRVVTRRSAR